MHASQAANIAALAASAAGPSAHVVRQAPGFLGLAVLQRPTLSFADPAAAAAIGSMVGPCNGAQLDPRQLRPSPDAASSPIGACNSLDTPSSTCGNKDSSSSSGCSRCNAKSARWGRGRFGTTDPSWHPFGKTIWGSWAADGAGSDTRRHPATSWPGSRNAALRGARGSGVRYGRVAAPPAAAPHDTAARLHGGRFSASARPQRLVDMPYEYDNVDAMCHDNRLDAARLGGLVSEGLPPFLPHAVRHFHGGSHRGGAAGDLNDGAGTAPRPYRSAPRDAGLGASMEVFDRQLKSLHRDRSAALLDSSDPLLAAVSERLLDRLEDCRRSFPTAVVLGGAALPVLHRLAGGRAGIERLVVVDSSQDMLDRVKREAAQSRSLPGAKPWPRLLCVRGDEEHLPLQPHSVDLIISCLGLHWANDLPGAMAQCRMALAPDGLFLAALLGGDTLQELRISCALSQMEREGGVSAVVSPLAQVRDAGNLLTRADLRLPAVDVDRFRIGYPSPLELVQHLRALGESNAAVNRRRALSRDSALAAAAVYQSMFGSPEEGGSVSATFEVIFMTGWAPAANQPKAAKRGSATVSFQELADGLVKGGAAVGGTADEGLATPRAEDEPRPGDAAGSRGCPG